MGAGRFTTWEQRGGQSGLAVCKEADETRGSTFCRPQLPPPPRLALFPALKLRRLPSANFPFVLGARGASSAAVAGMDGGPASGSDHGPLVVLSGVRATGDCGLEMSRGFSFPKQLSPGQQVARGESENSLSWPGRGLMRTAVGPQKPEPAPHISQLETP